MSPLVAYALGLLTLPGAAAVLFAIFVAWVRITTLLERRWGITLSASMRQLDGVSDYTLRHDIWWERSWGPVFVGGWHHTYYDGGADRETARLNRWIGVGNSNGACIQAFRSVDLGPVEG